MDSRCLCCGKRIKINRKRDPIRYCLACVLSYTPEELDKFSVQKPKKES